MSARVLGTLTSSATGVLEPAAWNGLARRDGCFARIGEFGDQFGDHPDVALAGLIGGRERFAEGEAARAAHVPEAFEDQLSLLGIEFLHGCARRLGRLDHGDQLAGG